MSTISVPGRPGKYEVLFNGSRLACYNDTDCPGAGICAINQTWSVDEGGWCMCFSKGGLAGDNCDEICEMGQARLAIGIIVMVLALGVALLAIGALLGQCARRQTLRKWITALNVTLLSIGLGAVFLIIYHLMVFMVTMAFPSTFVITVSEDGRELRRTSQEGEYASFVMLVLTQCVSANAPLLLPLIWLNLANALFNFRLRSIKAVHVISVAFCCVVCFVQFPLYILAANNYQGKLMYYGEIAAQIWYAVYGFIILINLIAALRIAFVKRALKKRPRSDQNQRFLQIIDRVFKAAIALIINFSCLIGLIYGAQERQNRTFYNDPTCNLIGGSRFTQSDLCLRLSLFFVIFSSITCLWFIFPDVMKLITSASSRYGNNNGSAPNEPGRFHSLQNVQIYDAKLPTASQVAETTYGPDVRNEITVI